MPDINLNIIKETIKSFFPDGQVFLFGSRARQNQNTFSDYDIIVVIEMDFRVSEKMKYQALIRKRLAKERIPVDIIIQSRSELEINKNLSGHIVSEAVIEGILL